LSRADLRAVGMQLAIHAAGGLLVLLMPAALSVYKPWGLTRYGQRAQHEQRKASQPPYRGSTSSRPWGLYVLLGMIGLLLLFGILHLMGGGVSSAHEPPFPSGTKHH